MALWSSVLLWCLATAGCAYYAFPKAQQLYMSGRYAEIKRYAETKKAQGAALELDELSSLCGAYWKLQEYDKLLPCSAEMERRLQAEPVKRGALDWDVAYAFMWGNALGFIEMGEPDRAIEAARHAYQFGVEHQLDPFHQTYSLGTLALAYALRGDRINALKTSDLLEKVDTSDYKYQGLGVEKHINLAKVYMALGEYDQALAIMQRPEGLTTSYKVVSHLFFGKSFTGFGSYQQIPHDFMLAKSLLETGHREEAKRHYDALLRHPDAPRNRDILWLAWSDRGRIAEQEGSLKEAIGFYERSVELLEEARATFKTEATKIGFVGDKQTVYQHLIAVLCADAQYARAFEYVERSKSRALVDLLASKKEFAVQQGRGQEITAILKQLDALETQDWRQGAGPGGDERQRRSRTMQLSRLKTQAPHLASLVTVTAVSLPHLQARLASDETLVEYYASGEALVAFVLTHEAIHAVPLSRANLTERIQEFRSAVEDPRADQWPVLAQQLDAQLIKPIEPLITTPNLILVPHGMLHYLPFGALSDGSRALIDRYHLRYLPSASVMEYLETPAKREATEISLRPQKSRSDFGDSVPDMLRMSRGEISQSGNLTALERNHPGSLLTSEMPRGEMTGSSSSEARPHQIPRPGPGDLMKVMVIGNPALGDQRPLAYAEQEAHAVAKAFPESTVLLRKEATETAFKQLSGQFRYLHVATHGVFASNDPLHSGLWLTKDADNDGLLTVEELYSLTLDADLVTLSACETGLSKVSNGDELVGLARGFLYAGSRAIVASLWSVDDEATSSLMSEFYANLATANVRDALRQAQLQTRKRYPHPFYWAAFQLTGQS